MDSQTRPDGFLWIGRLLEAGLEEPSAWHVVQPRKNLPAYRVMFDLVRQDLDAGGGGAEQLFNLAVVTTVAAKTLLVEVGQQYGKDPREVALALAAELGPQSDLTDVLPVLFEDSVNDVLVDVLGQEPEKFYDLLGSLTELCCVMILGAADHRGVTPGEIVREFQLAAEDQG